MINHEHPNHLPHDRRDMAVRQLETALRLYFEGEDFYSVITLAGAADTVLGQVLRALGKKPNLESSKQAAAAIYEHEYGADRRQTLFRNVGESRAQCAEALGPRAARGSCI